MPTRARRGTDTHGFLDNAERATPPAVPHYGDGGLSVSGVGVLGKARRVEVDEFERFFDLMRPRLMRRATRTLDIDTANEVAIAALHTIWTKNLPAPRDHSEQLRLQALAYRILDGHVRNVQRARARRARLLDAVVDQQISTRTDEPDVADWIDRQESERAIQELLAGLPDNEREVVILVIDGFRINEIATILGRRPGAISMRLNRARRHLRTALERRDGD